MPPNPWTFGGPNNPNDAAQADSYTNGVGIVNDYQFYPGVCVLPVAEDPPTDPAELATWSPVVVIRMHAPYRVRTVRYDETKSNNPPVVPSPVDSGSFVFLGGSMEVSTALNTSFWNFDWTVASEYTFVENCVSRPQDGLVLGIPPWQWTTTDYTQATFQPASGVTVGAIAHAGNEPLVGLSNALNGVQFTNPNGYYYTIPSYFPGVFFNDFLVNGGTPVVPAPPV